MGGVAGEALLALTCGCELAARLYGSAAAPRCEGGTALSANAGAAVGRATLAAASAAGGHSRPSGAAKAAESLKDSALPPNFPPLTEYRGRDRGGFPGGIVWLYSSAAHVKWSSWRNSCIMLNVAIGFFNFKNSSQRELSKNKKWATFY